MLTDPAERALTTGLEDVPLVIQDKSFVPQDIALQDSLWAGGPYGDLWFPHVYMSVQNPWDLGGVNAFGRWHYGPWFNPPTPTCTAPNTPAGCIVVGPVPDEYHQTICDTNPADPACTAPWEPPMRPGVPNPSIPGEAFMDTPVVNGSAYPLLNVEPKAYRFRVLSAGNDRMFNLQLYVAADKDRRRSRCARRRHRPGQRAHLPA